jgi:hypothetical protein
MISHKEFYGLKLKDFYTGTDIEIASAYIYMEEIWCGETLGFTAFLALENDPLNTRCLILDLSNHEEQLHCDILAHIGLPLHAGLSVSELEKMFGPASETYKFQNDRLTYDYRITGDNPYNLSCTVHNNKGLIFIDISCAG